VIEFPEKLRPLLQERARYRVLYGGRGGAKSWSVARALLVLGASRPMRILCARETQTSITQSVHQLLADQIEALGLGSFWQVLETEIRGLNGSQINFAGLRQQGISNLKSWEGVDIVWAEEAGVIGKKSWDVLTPTIRKPGSEIWITFNPELDSDETYERFVLNPPAGAWVCKVNWSDNPWFPAVLDDERRDLERRDPVAYRTIWEGECRPAVEGAIYGNELSAALAAGRIREVPHDPLLKTHTVWDLGWNDDTSILLVQRAASEVRIIGHISGSQRTLADYVQDLKALPYQWGCDFLPHDGASKSIQTGRSAAEIVSALGRSVQIGARLDPEQGIQAARLMFARCYFDKTSTRGLMDSLKRYRRAMNARTGSFGAPLHDDASHDADAFRYLAVAEPQMSNESWGGGTEIVYRNRRTA
jgi:phage terminase large subunit